MLAVWRPKNIRWKRHNLYKFLSVWFLPQLSPLFVLLYIFLSLTTSYYQNNSYHEGNKYEEKHLKKKMAFWGGSKNFCKGRNFKGLSFPSCSITIKNQNKIRQNPYHFLKRNTTKKRLLYLLSYLLGNEMKLIK